MHLPDECFIAAEACCANLPFLAARETQDCEPAEGFMSSHTQEDSLTTGDDALDLKRWVQVFQTGARAIANLVLSRLAHRAGQDLRQCCCGSRAACSKALAGESPFSYSTVLLELSAKLASRQLRALIFSQGAKLTPLAISVAFGVVLRFFVPTPEAVSVQAWTLLSIFVSTIAGEMILCNPSVSIDCTTPLIVPA